MNCESCPARSPFPCPGTGTRRRAPHPRYCELIQLDPTTWTPLIRAVAEADATGPAAEAGPAIAPTIAAAAPIPETTRAAILECPHGSTPPPLFGQSCACDRLCNLNPTPRVVTFRDCLQCHQTRPTP